MNVSSTRQTVARALELLSSFSQTHQEWSVSELSRAKGIEKSTVSRLLNTLHVYGFLWQDPITRQYSLGGKILELADVLRPETILAANAGAILNRLAHESGETAILGLRRGWTCLCAQIIESNKGLRAGPRVGQQTPLNAGAIGKAMLANLPDDDLKRFLSGELQRFTSETITDPVRLLDELRSVRQKGYALSFSELEEGVAAIAVPVFDSSRTAIATVALDMPALRFGTADDYIDALRVAATELTSVASGRD